MGVRVRIHVYTDAKIQFVIKKLYINMYFQIYILLNAKFLDG